VITSTLRLVPSAIVVVNGGRVVYSNCKAKQLLYVDTDAEVE
jgi:hypothetical protein